MSKPLWLMLGMMCCACAEDTMESVSDTGFAFRCADGTRFVVAYEGADKAVVRINGNILELTRERSGSGARYGDGSTALWTKGNGAFMEVDGEIAHSDCELSN